MIENPLESSFGGAVGLVYKKKLGRSRANNRTNFDRFKKLNFVSGKYFLRNI